MRNAHGNCGPLDCFQGSEDLRERMQAAETDGCASDFMYSERTSSSRTGNSTTGCLARNILNGGSRMSASVVMLSAYLLRLKGPVDIIGGHFSRSS